MALSDCINRRLLLAVLRAPSTIPTVSSRARTATGWIRTITSSSLRPRNSAPAVSFGTENDVLLAPYLERLEGREKKAKSARGIRSEVQRSEELESTSADDFEISDYVDRSATKSQDVELQDNALEADVAESTVHKTKDTRPRKAKGVSGKAALAAATTPRVSASSRRQSSIIRKIAGGKVVGAAASDISEARSTLIRKKPEPWQSQKNALREKFGDQGWQPRKKLSPDAMEGIRGLHEQDSAKYSTEVLAEQFKVSPEAIRRILKSKWSRNTTPEKVAERRERWAKRHDRIWDQQAELGLRPQRTKEKETEDPDQFEKDMARKEALGEA
ncbi:Required for respiratory growth protein 9 mitochondrial [Neophaeococcomyces mojaviensis]|uniref:Required for respiratory growth protein 9 mitochondrial n=1 Tax=Neophaeococcomyces mojaviensis TaxID=3383035 RepID=A0ACC2ZTH6_9EURO|nr:Required for respiratory growth protein 9 mitochondrial [Knufia sp. JES_112]